MSLSHSDTIAAISSAVGPAARMLVRISGPSAPEIAACLCCNDLSLSVQRSALSFRSISVPATVYRFIAPKSYTGEDLIEFHLPGNPLLARLLLEELVTRGARHAEPGEFTARAYFNSRISLEAAEGVAATIAAQNEGELRAARQLMSGELSRQLSPVMDALADTLALVEAGIDFSEEDITFIDATETARRIDAVDEHLADILRESARFEQLSHEPTIVLLGRPNAGKSTLLNTLAGHHRAVVSDVAGTTRDVLSVEIRLARGIVRLMDIAGIEDGFQAISAGDIDQQMQTRARRALESADVIVLVRDAQDGRPNVPALRQIDLVVESKIDLIDATGRALTDSSTIPISAHTGENIDLLRTRLDTLAFGEASSGSKLALNARHRAAIDDSQAALLRARGQVQQTPELLALDLRAALNALGEIRGQITPDDLLGRLFATFCIGK